MKQRINEFLQNLGCSPEMINENDMAFAYQGGYFIIHGFKVDDDYLSISMPGICDISEENRNIIFEAANYACLRLKCAKVNIVDDEVWVFFEHFLCGSEKIEEFVPRALSILFSARNELYKYLEGKQ